MHCVGLHQCPIWGIIYRIQLYSYAPISEKCVSILKDFTLAIWLRKQTNKLKRHFYIVLTTSAPKFKRNNGTWLFLTAVFSDFKCLPSESVTPDINLKTRQLQGPAQHWKETKKLKMALPKGINNMESWVLASSVTENVLFPISLYNMYLFIEVIVQLMAHQITLYEVFYILLFILASILFLHQLYVTVAKEHSL